MSVLAKRVGVGADTIRYYEKTGLLPERTASDYRNYDESAIDRLRFMALSDLDYGCLRSRHFLEYATPDSARANPPSSCCDSTSRKLTMRCTAERTAPRARGGSGSHPGR